MKPFTSGIYALTFAGLLALDAPGMAQEATNAIAAEQSAPATDLATVIEQIAAQGEKTRARIKELSDAIDVKTLEIEGANKLFDDLVAQLREQASVGDPDGDFVKRLGELEIMAKGDSEQAKLAGYADFEEEFLEDAAVFAEQKSTLVSEWEALDRRIRAVESERERVVFLIKLRRYDDIQELYNEATGILRDGADRVKQVEDALREREGNAVED